jgi:hypothetical protein
LLNNKKESENSCQALLDAKEKDLLSRKISDLALKIPGTHLEEQINRLYWELEKSGISFKPKTYLSDEWGCPHEVPVIGIPFYLADPKLCELESRLTGTEVETDEEVMMCLRHEAGHAFNYAHRLYQKAMLQRRFGAFSHPYLEAYKTDPFSAHFVRHIAGWYAQKHPDEDFAETFAVWLTPGSDWEKVYAGTPAVTKLIYVDHIVSLYGRKTPVVTVKKLDKPLSELTMTLDTWYESNRKFNNLKITLHPIIDVDLRRLFPEKEGQPAADILSSSEKRLIRDVNNWTGIDRHMLSSLLKEITARVRSLKLKISLDQQNSRVLSAAIFLATLAMNFQLKGEFVEA